MALDGSIIFSVNDRIYILQYHRWHAHQCCVMDRFTSASGRTKPSTVRAAVGRSSTEMGAMRYLFPLWSALLSATSGENALGKGTVSTYCIVRICGVGTDRMTQTHPVSYTHLTLADE